MSESEHDYQLSLRALRAESHPQVDKARVRERLVARGILGAAAASSVAAQATAQTGLASTTKLLVGTVLASLTVFSALHFAPPVVKPLPALEVTSAPTSERATPMPRYTEYGRSTVAVDEPARQVDRASRPEPSMLDLARENALISAAVQALRGGDRSAAKRSLDQHEREFPNGFLRAERDKARARLGASK